MNSLKWIYKMQTKFMKCQLKLHIKYQQKAHFNSNNFSMNSIRI